ncbi:hypothetical protein [Vibrio alginolyticus]|uniref:hypothetical protein n=1 Tax=Vibrio alginolyticus TaxID=663 RepID=UPI001A2C6FDA|nr:hypothetical protein [Vibrio parahaemolyticus]HAS6209285.1 hypothetical protein [Vibrio vulnificus]
MKYAKCVFALAGLARDRYYWYSFTFLKAILVTIVTVQASTDIDVVVKYQIEAKKVIGEQRLCSANLEGG